MKSVFISYSTADTATAEQIRDHLETAGIPCWMAPRDINPGEDYAEQIITAIEGCTVLLLVLSETSNHSQYVIKEVERAIAKRKVVIPLRIHNVTPSRSLEFFISNAQWIDAWQAPLETHLASLANAIRNLRSTAAPTAPPTERIIRPPVPSPTHEPATPRTNLPKPTTPFVGREGELAAILAQLRDPNCRLLTLVGQGGMGKTRLALEASRRFLDEMTLAPNGVFFVALEALTCVDQIAPAIINALGITLVNQSDPHGHLFTLLGEKRLLLLLDNFEHLLDGATLVSEMLAAAPHLKVLVTSRTALALQEEWLHSVSGMDLPATRAQTAEEAQSSSAVQMFVQAARRVRPNFALATEIEHVGQLCRQVDGMPLALELAAAWLRSLTSAQIVAELQKSLDLLTTTLRNVPTRHRSIQAVFEQSWQLLEKAERTILCQFVIFEGGFDWTAAKAVTSVSLPILTDLVDRSWLQVSQEARYDLHPLVRSYLLTKFNTEYGALSGETPDQVHNRHSRYFAALDEKISVKDGEREVGNIRAGWIHATQHLHVETLLQYVNGSIEWVIMTGAGDQLLMQTLARLSASEVTTQSGMQRQLTAKLLSVRAHALNLAGRPQQAEMVAQECLAYLARFPDTDCDISYDNYTFSIHDLVQGDLAWILITQSRLHEADALLAGLLATAQTLNNPLLQSEALHFLAYSADERGSYAEAAAYLHQGLAVLVEKPTQHYSFYARLAVVSYLTGKYELSAQMLTKATALLDFEVPQQRLLHQILWARLDIVANDLSTARARCLAVLPRARELSTKNVQIWALNELGRIALLDANPDEATRYFEEAMTIADGMGRRKEQARARVGLGQAAIAQGKLAVARGIFQQVLAIAWPQDILPEVLGAVVGLAEVAAHEGSVEQAAIWLHLAVEHSATPHHVRLQAADLLAKVSAELPAINDPSRPATPIPTLEEVVSSLHPVDKAVSTKAEV